MKILFIYTKSDDALRDKVKRLREHKAEVSMLSLLEYKLDDEKKSHTFDIDSKLDFLEESSKLRVANRVYKRKKLISYLDYYDLIILYKCEKSSLFIVDDLAPKCYDFFILSSKQDDEISFIKKPLYNNLYKKARFIIFNSKLKLKNFNFDYQDKVRVIYDGINMLKEIDSISQENIFKASHAMGLELDKDVVYADLSSTIERQLTFLDDLASLKIEKLKNTTFIFHLKNHNLQEREMIKDSLNDKNFDYLLIEEMINDKQKALLFKLANKSIILSNDETNHALELSLYAKNNIYLYTGIKIDPLFEENNFYIKTFKEFQNEEVSSKDSIEEDLLTKNSQMIYDIFDPEKSIERCIEVIKEL